MKSILKLSKALMLKIKNKIKYSSSKFVINPATYFLILTFLFTGLIKNILLIYLIVIFHELGHVLIIKKLKYKIIKVEIYPMGGITFIDKKINTKIFHELLISIFGIIFQIILEIIFFYLFQNNLIRSNTYNLFNNYNRTIMIFNMLPIIPLDGYQFFRSLGEYFFPYKKNYYLSLIISIISVLLFITYNEIYSLNNYLIISFLIFKIYLSIKEFKYTYYRFLTERHIYDFKVNKIKYENKTNINLLKKDTYHYFKENNEILSEKKLLSKFFKN